MARKGSTMIAGGQVVDVWLAPNAEAPRSARSIVDTLRARLSRDEHRDVQLALSELVTNSVTHGSSPGDDPVSLRIRTSDAGVS